MHLPASLAIELHPPSSPATRGDGDAGSPGEEIPLSEKSQLKQSSTQNPFCASEGASSLLSDKVGTGSAAARRHINPAEPQEQRMQSRGNWSSEREVK